ncbi:amidase family protein [Burkholderia pyrrocinia]|uniref:amidase family protein n=1 Tax=Burkholderia pyrrocinia TaxID=60550 RepID=UPI0030CE644C|nr:hypothetical protein [Burkholderia cepacia]
MSTLPNIPSASPNLFQSATDWLARLRERRIGAVELLNLHLEQISKHNEALNAVVAQDVEGALEAARRADDMHASSALPLLRGLPMTIKGTYEVVGMPSTCGFPFLAQHFPNKDAEPVARLKAPGAIMLGKTNVPPGAFDWQSSNPVYGTSKNPWNLARSVGGCSGGAAAAVAAVFTPLEMGSDIGGSIRCPAHFRSVYGHKPSYGVVPMGGHIPPLPGQYGGPSIRSPRDLELALDVLVAPNELDRPAWTVSIPPSRHKRLQDFRVALWTDAFAVDGACLEAIEAYLQDLRVDTQARPELDPNASYEAYLSTLLPIMGSGLPPAAVQHLVDSAAGLPLGDNGYVPRAARALTMRKYQAFTVAEQRERLFRNWRDFFTRRDLVICPVMPTVAYPHDSRGEGASDPITACESRSMIVDGRPRPYFDGLQWISLATVADRPATAVPTGRFVDGMPVGVQLIGPYTAAVRHASGARVWRFLRASRLPLRMVFETGEGPHVQQVGCRGQ